MVNHKPPLGRPKGQQQIRGELAFATEKGKAPSYMNEKEKQLKTETGTSYQVGQNNLQLFGLDINAPVFFTSSLTITVFVIGTLLFQERATVLFESLRVWMTTHLDWVFMLTCSLLVLFCLYLIASPLGKVRIGGRDAVPDYSTFTWIAMLFSAGLAIGLVYFGVVEPVHHFQNPPFNMTRVYDAQHPPPDINDPATKAAWDMSLAAIAFHWGLHGWAGYAVVGLGPRVFHLQSGLAARAAFGVLPLARGAYLGLAWSHY